MTEVRVKGKEGRAVGVGSRALMLLCDPLSISLLEALRKGPKTLRDLRVEIPFAPQTTVRVYLRRLGEATVVARRESETPRSLRFELTVAGRELLAVKEALRVWLQVAPGGPLRVGTAPAMVAIKALVEGWATRMIRALATAPLSLTELDRLIASPNHASLERRLTAMRLCGLVEVHPRPGRGTPYTATWWLRRAVAPLAAATRWERAHEIPGAALLTKLDVEGALLLALAPLSLSPELSGDCRLIVELGEGESRRLAGVRVAIRRGRVGACTTRLGGEVDAWALGSPSAWLAAAIERRPQRLKLGGETRLARETVEGLHGFLFGGGAGGR